MSTVAAEYGNPGVSRDERLAYQIFFCRARTIVYAYKPTDAAGSGDQRLAFEPDDDADLEADVDEAVKAEQQQTSAPKEQPKQGTMTTTAPEHSGSAATAGDSQHEDANAGIESLETDAGAEPRPGP